MEQNELKNIVSHFAIRGTVSEIKPLGAGLINDTLLVTTAEADAPNYVLQRVNTNVFPDVDLVMRNIYAVTTHIRKKLEAAGETEMCIRDRSSRAAGKAFGQFQAMLADIPVELGETIKDFHNMEFRLQQLREVIAKDPVGRVAEPEVQAMLKEIDARAEYMCQAERMGREGILPKRVCHCDTKVNNMMFDQQDNVLCVIDLDTVMPNFIFSDYGDFLRTGANKVAEDHQDMDAVCFDVDIFKEFTKGYLASASSFLTRVEIENLPYAVKLFPYMQCVRFLWDYLSGDKYWKCQYANHNFVRANNQLHLLLSIEKHEPEMEAFIADCLK